MSSYRNFITGQAEDEEMVMMSRIYSDAGSADSGDQRRSSSPSRRSTNHNNINNNQYTGAPLLREWGNISSRCELDVEELNWYNPNNEGDGDDDSYKKYHYSHPIYHSKKFKTFLLVVMVAGAIIGSVTMFTKKSSGGVSVGSSSGDGGGVDEGNLPDWNKELNEVLLEEEQAKKKKKNKVEKEKEEDDEEELAHENIGIDSSRPPKVDNDEKTPDDNKVQEEEEETKEEEDSNAAAAAAAAVPRPIAIAPKKPEAEEGIAALLSGDGIEAITRHILCCSSNPTINPTDTSSKTTTTNNKNNNAVVSAEYSLAASYRPRWYNRSNGWAGQTYTEAREFCDKQTEEDGDGGISPMQLCPYKVYCPTGPHHLPLGGFREDTSTGGDGGDFSSSHPSSSSRSPISNHPNGWVQVGMQNVCVQYTIFEDGEEEVSATMDDKQDVVAVVPEKEEEEVTNQVKGDDAPVASFDAINDIDNKEVGLVEETYVPVMAAKSGPSSMTEEVVAAKAKDVNNKNEVQATTSSNNKPSSESSASSITASATTATATTSKTVDITNILHQKFKPLWLSAKEGWNGGSHADAVEFCNSIRGKKLCPYSAMCPHGPGKEVMGGRHHLEFNVVGTQYAPVMGGENHWVMIGSTNGDGGEEEEETRCKTHRQLEGTSPEWGLNGDRAEVKQHVMCCTIE
ncbi:hypothetical protein ACHAXR_007324 [Thalassiosira sp. AJA248-18]